MMIAIYPGTFDPFTNGHLDILLRAHNFCGSLLVAIARDPQKSPLFSALQRQSFIADILHTHRLAKAHVIIFDGLLVNLAAEQDAHTIVRGLRAISDFEYEFQMASMNSYLQEKIETIFLAASGNNHFISSGMVKQIAQAGGDVNDFVSPMVAQALRDHYKT
ncbi:MAG: pantetheine-phosphate adenylyltransferase [Pseudomonadota bacterium]